MENRTLYGTEDGLVMNEEVGSWSAEKYSAVRIYADIFTRSMKGRWRGLTYLDLYAGSGLSRVKGTSEILLGSPLIALSVDVEFNQFIFCEEDDTKLSALKRRVDRLFPKASVRFIHGDCNQTIQEIRSAIPSGSLTLCFVDPYRLDIQFETIRSLANGRNIDFLCLLASRMDAGRNPHNYTKEDRPELDRFLGSNEWREKWESSKKDFAKEPNLGDFVCKEFSGQMERLGYLPTEAREMKPIKTDAGVLLYHLALFSKSAKAKKFWNQASIYSHPQRDLF